MKRFPYIMAFIWVALMQLHPLFAQSPDTVAKTATGTITDRLEDIASGIDFSPDFTDLVDDYLYYHNHPLNLNNQDDIEKLIELNLISRAQADNLRVYLLKYRHLQTIYELKYIDGFDAVTLKNMLPFITVREVKKAEPPDFHQVFKRGKSKLIARFGTQFQKPAGYLLSPDSAPSKPGSVYLGNIQKYYLRYGFDYRKKLRFGFTAEKDAGEVFLKNSLPDTVLHMAGDKITPGFDFYSGYIYAADLGPVKKLIAGDYHLEFGQGLTLWSGLAFGFSSDATGIKKYGRGVRPNTSVNENRFFRGAAIQSGWKNLELTAFYSRNRADATLVERPDTLSRYEISGMQETGNHRTLNELTNKNSMSITTYGGRLQFKGKWIAVGGTLYRNTFTPPLMPDSVPYRYFSFRGSNLSVYGLDANVVAGKWEFFGEYSGNISGGHAAVGGVNGFLTDRFSFTLFYRNIGVSYHNLFNYPVTESSNPVGESGIYLGTNILLTKRFTLAAYTDYFRYSWLRYRVDAPSAGRAAMVRLDYVPMRTIQMYLRFRYKQKEENSSDEFTYIKKLSLVQRYEWRWNMQWQLTGFLFLKNRVEYVFYKKENREERGFLTYQDILYRPEKFPLQATLRFALFDTDGWESRIYAYESDVLYLFTIPAYYDKGRRFYLMLKWQAGDHTSIWLRYAQTHYYFKQTIGNGPDEIKGNNRSDIRVQMIWKF